MTRLLLGGSAAMAVALALLGWYATQQRDARIEAEQALYTAQESNEALSAHIVANDLAQREAEASAAKARSEARALIQALKAARGEADEAYQKCMDVRVPDAVPDAIERMRSNRDEG